MGKERKASAPVEGASLLFQNVYCVCFPQRDSVEALQGELATARKRFFANGRKAVKVGRHEIVKGFDGDLRGKISRWGFYWKKTALGVSGQKGVALEQVFDQKGGYVLVNRDFRGLIVSRVFFNKEHAWQKSEYYEPWDPVTAKVMFKPDPMEDTVGRYDWDAAKKLYRSVILHPAPYQIGSAEQALVNARFGEPPLIVAVGDELLCYCPQKEAEARAQALEEINSGTMVLMPAWEIKEGAVLGEEGEEDTGVTFTSLEEYAKVEPKEKPVEAEAVEVLPPPPAPLPPEPVPEPEPIPEPEPEPEPEFTPEIETPAEPEQPEIPEQSDELDIEFILADARQEMELPLPVPEPELIDDSPILPVVREVMEEPPPKRAMRSEPPRPAMGEEDSSILAAARQASGVREQPVSAPPPRRSRHSGAPRLNMGSEDASILSAARQASGISPEPPRRGGVVPRHSSPGPEKTSRPLPAVPTNGKGRTEQAGGLTAYEGDYKDGKRQGFGSHYYKSGDLSYAGFWRDDKKDGLGVSFREGDHALHVSRWVLGRPGQLVSLFDKEGGLRFGGHIINGKKEGAGVSINSADGSVLVTKWSDGQNTGLASAFDPEGNLLYYGSWKNGKRHGHGTEFDKNGGIVFDGEWRDDQYFNGILYQKPAEEPQFADPEYPTEPDWE